MIEKENGSIENGSDTTENRTVPEVPEHQVPQDSIAKSARVGGSPESPALTKNQPVVVREIESTVPDEEMDDGGFLCL